MYQVQGKRKNPLVYLSDCVCGKRIKPSKKAFTKGKYDFGKCLHMLLQWRL